MFESLPTFSTITPRHYASGAWRRHVPFGYDLVALLKPEKLVELGTYRGESFFAFAQSVQENSLPTTCYAVDTWQGDEHAEYDDGEEMFAGVEAHRAAHYSGFTHLLRCTFDEARAQFAEGSIDLLHIDGLHTYEAVKNDFDTWLPKAAKNGIIIFHDVEERRDDFGVWKLWGEIAPQYPSFSFRHGHGLGVLSVNPDTSHLAPFLQKLLSGDGKFGQKVEDYYQLVSRSLEAGVAENRAATLDADLFTARRALEKAEAKMEKLKADSEKKNGELKKRLEGAKEDLAKAKSGVGWHMGKPFRMLGK